jgi:hypothetical protein
MFEIGADRASPLAAFAALAVFCARTVGTASRAAASDAALMPDESRRIELEEKGYVSPGQRGPPAEHRAQDGDITNGNVTHG